MAHAAPPAAVQPQAVSLIKEFLLSPSVAGMAGQSGCSACLRAAVQPALGLPPHQISQIGSSYDGSRPCWGLGSSRASRQQGLSLLPGLCCPAARIRRLDASFPSSCVTSSAGLSPCQ